MMRYVRLQRLHRYLVTSLGVAMALCLGRGARGSGLDLEPCIRVTITSEIQAKLSREAMEGFNGLPIDERLSKVRSLLRGSVATDDARRAFIKGAEENVQFP